jgi:HD-GYP domain-containing protein (c-di-GMP phosphodiesterase class II)
VRKHPQYSLEILRRIPGFAGLSEIAASHHEKLDGSGYFRNFGAEQLSLPARILAVADIYDALAANRPYRDGLPLETVFGIIGKDAPRALDVECFEALKCSTTGASKITEDLLRLSAGAGQDSSRSATIGSMREARQAGPAAARIARAARDSTTIA